MSKSSGENQQAEGSELSNFHSKRSSVCKRHDLSMMSKMLACLVIALGVAIVVLSGCNTKTASSAAITPVPTPVVQTADKPAATTANGGAEAMKTRATAAKSAAGAETSKKPAVAGKVPGAAHRHVAAVARKHKRVPLRNKATVAAGPASAMADEKKRRVVPVTTVPAACKPAATAEKQGQPGAWESPLRSLRTPKCGPSGCGPTGCP